MKTYAQVQSKRWKVEGNNQPDESTQEQSGLERFQLNVVNWMILVRAVAHCNAMVCALVYGVVPVSTSLRKNLASKQA